MSRQNIVVLTLIGVLASAVVFSPAIATVAATGADDASRFKWKKKVGEAAFETGRELFEKGEYRAAFKSFKDARKHAGNKTTKRAVALWRRGSEGGVWLVKFRDMAKKGQRRAALNQAESKLLEFEETPIAEEMQTFISELSSKLYVVLENFERRSGRFSEKYGKSFESDPEFVKLGKQSLKWKTVGNNPELKVKGIPRNLNDFEAISMWVCFPKGRAPFQLVFKSRGQSTSNTGKSMVNAFMSQQKGHKGWRRIEVPLNRFAVQGDATWDRVADFRIQFSGKRNLTLYVDDIILIKK